MEKEKQKALTETSFTNILLVEDDRKTRLAFREEIQLLKDAMLVAETGRETKALEALATGLVDAMILDLELEEGSGLDILNKMTDNKGIEKPVIVVITNIQSHTVRSVLLDSGVDFVYNKSNPQYGPKTVLDILLKCSQFKKHKDILEGKEHHFTDEENQINKELILRNTISKNLKDMNFPVKGLGTTYLVESIYYIITKGIGKRRISLTKEIYPMLAKKYESSFTAVERNIRTAIESAWAHTLPMSMTKMYPFDYSSSVGRPTNMEFLYNMSQLINNER